MKEIVYIDHAESRRKQRGFTTLEIELALERPEVTKRRNDGRIEIMAKVKTRTVKVVYEEEENYLKIVSVM